MSLALRIQARDIALSQTGTQEPAAFTLQNAGKYEPGLLRLIAGHLDYVKTIEKKVPLWFANTKTLPFAGINLEQSSSELTARYKAAFVTGKAGLDLTGGLGVDSYFLSQKFDRFVHNEPHAELSEVAQHNFSVLGSGNVQFTTSKAEEYPWPGTAFAWVYLDPSRRNGSSHRLVMPEDCLPDLTVLRETILQHADQIMVKYSPMLDLRLALERLKTVHEIAVLAERNEVKELIFILGKEPVPSPTIRCVNLGTAHPEFTFTLEEEKKALPDYALPSGYLYEPNAALLKAGAFNCSALRFGLQKIAKNSHLYTHDEVVTNYPGRVMKIKAVTSFDKKRLNEIVPARKANIICRNFPMKPDEVKKKLQWKDGGDTYLYLTENSSGKKLALVTERVPTI